MTAEDVWKAALAAAQRGLLIDDQLLSAEVRPHLHLALEIGEAILLTSTAEDRGAKEAAVSMLQRALTTPSHVIDD